MIGDRLLQPGPALDRRRVRQDAAERQDAALATDGVDQGLGRDLAIPDAVEGDVGDVIGSWSQGCRSAGLFHWVTTKALAATQASTIGRASAESLGSTLMMRLPPVLARMARMSAVPFSLSPSVTSVT